MDVLAFLGGSSSSVSCTRSTLAKRLAMGEIVMPDKCASVALASTPWPSPILRGPVSLCWGSAQIGGDCHHLFRERETRPCGILRGGERAPPLAEIARNFES